MKWLYIEEVQYPSAVWRRSVRRLYIKDVKKGMQYTEGVKKKSNMHNAHGAPKERSGGEKMEEGDARSVRPGWDQRSGGEVHVFVALGIFSPPLRSFGALHWSHPRYPAVCKTNEEWNQCNAPKERSGGEKIRSETEWWGEAYRGWDLKRLCTCVRFSSTPLKGIGLLRCTTISFLSETVLHL